MGLPTATPRVQPDPLAVLTEGWKCVRTFSANPAVRLYEKDLTPPGGQVDKKIDMTSQFNQKYKTSASPTLIDVTDGDMTVQYGPDSYADVFALLGVVCSVTDWFPNGKGICYFGHLESFVPSSLAGSKLPDAKCKIVADNRDPATGLEQGPVEVSQALQGGFITYLKGANNPGPITVAAAAQAAS